MIIVALVILLMELLRKKCNQDLAICHLHSYRRINKKFIDKTAQFI